MIQILIPTVTAIRLEDGVDPPKKKKKRTAGDETRQNTKTRKRNVSKVNDVVAGVGVKIGPEKDEANLEKLFGIRKNLQRGRRLVVVVANPQEMVVTTTTTTANVAKAKIDGCEIEKKKRKTDPSRPGNNDEARVRIPKRNVIVANPEIRKRTNTERNDHPLPGKIPKRAWEAYLPFHRRLEKASARLQLPPQA